MVGVVVSALEPLARVGPAFAPSLVAPVPAHVSADYFCRFADLFPVPADIMDVGRQYFFRAAQSETGGNQIVAGAFESVRVIVDTARHFTVNDAAVHQNSEVTLDRMPTAERSADVALQSARPALHLSGSPLRTTLARAHE